MQHVFNLSNSRIGVIEYYDKTTFPNNERSKYNSAENEQNEDLMEDLLSTPLPIKADIQKVYFIQKDKTQLKTSEYNESVYSIDGNDLFHLKTAISEIEKLYEGKTQTLQEFFSED